MGAWPIVSRMSSPESSAEAALRAEAGASAAPRDQRAAV
jgi:hypothetical protein